MPATADEALELLDIIARAADQHRHTLTMTPACAADILRCMIGAQYDPQAMIIEPGFNPYERPDPTGLTLPALSWLCWRDATEREAAMTIARRRHKA